MTAAIAAIVSLVFEVRIGGVFLAFPAILPATLTLIEKEESRRKAEDDDVGAVLGAAALILQNYHTLQKVDSSNTGTIVFTNTDSYYVQCLVEGNY